MLDNLSPFRKKKETLYQLNFYQFFKSRFGIGHSFAKLLCYFSGIHPFLKINKLLTSEYESPFANAYVIKRVKSFFFKYKEKMDDLLESKVNSFIKILKNIKSYRGRAHGNYLPVRGQRRRTNANTQRMKGKKEQSMLNIAEFALDPKKLKNKNKKKVNLHPKNKKGKKKK